MIIPNGFIRNQEPYPDAKTHIPDIKVVWWSHTEKGTEYIHVYERETGRHKAIFVYLN